MGTTATYGFRYPELGDAPNGPSQVKNLADDVEAEFQRRKIIARNLRSTFLSTGSGGAITRVLSTRAPVLNGRTYLVVAHCELSMPTVPGTSMTELRYTTNDTEPLVSSTILTRAPMDHRLASTPDQVIAMGLFHATSSGWLRVCACIQRAVGSNAVEVRNDNANYPMEITVEDRGPTVATSGTVY